MKQIFLFALFLNAAFLLAAQPVTGVWRGKITSGSGMFASTAKAELKLIARGDSLVGTCYYYANTNTYIRYAVKGYFDKLNNTVHWWDEQFLGEQPAGKLNLAASVNSMHSDADFNCPGNNVMKLDGKSKIGEAPEMAIHLEKIGKPFFRDEWDNVIEGYFSGMADPAIIDSVYAIAKPFDPGSVIAKTSEFKKKKKDTDIEKLVVESVTEKPVLITPKALPAEDKLPIKEAVVVPPPVVIAKTEPPVERPVTILVPEPKKDTEMVVKTVPLPTKPEAIIPSLVITIPPTGKKVDSAKPIEAVVVSPVIVKAQPATALKIDTIKQAKAGIAKQEIPIMAKPAIVPSPDVAKTSAPLVKKASAVLNSKPPEIKPAITLPPVVAKATMPLPKTAEKTPAPIVAKTNPILIKPIVIPEKIDPVALEKFISRKKINQGEIPMVGDTMELNFYDNAEVDGDSISLFVNGRLLFNHVMLTAQAYTFKLAIKDLPNGSELTMVAENLGSIPPNTAYMMAVVDGQRYSARLESTEQSSGVIKLMRRQ